MTKSTLGKTGSTPITKVGHTASNSYGSNPDSKRRGNTTPRELGSK